jgi:hypothetical protein
MTYEIEMHNSIIRLTASLAYSLKLFMNKALLPFVLMAITGLWASFGLAYDVESNSTGNKVYILLVNDNPSTSYEAITINNVPPSIVSSASASIIPASVAGGGSDLAALNFDVGTSAALNATGNLSITVTGSLDGRSVSFDIAVPLTVVSSAAVAQGEVGSITPRPDPDGIDSDSDGVSDILEYAFDSNPFNRESFPGEVETTNIPMVGFIGAAILALFLLVSGSSATRRRSAGMLALTAVFLLPVDLDAGTATRIQLVAHIPVPPPLPQLLSTTATASSQESGQSNCCSPAAAIDGNASTRWSSQFSDNQWLTLDLAFTHLLSEVIIDWEGASASVYEIQGSADNSNWTTISIQTGGTMGARTDTLTVAGSYRYVRMLGIDRATPYGYSIFEIEVYGLPGADEDSDGIDDSLDQCPNTPAGETVDATGCTIIIIDFTPDAFTFVPVTNAPLSSLRESNTITVSGLTDEATISISSGQYAINGGAFAGTNGIVTNGDTVVVRQTSASTFSTLRQATLTIGTFSAPFNVTTVGDQNTFGFLNKYNVAPNSVVTSNSILVSGINEPSSISITFGSYSIDGGPFTSATGTISNGQVLTLQQSSSTQLSTLVSTELTIDGVSDFFSVTTSAIAIPDDEIRSGNVNGVSVWQLPNAPNGDRPDQCWLAVGSDVDGDIYISGHDHINNSMLYRLHQSDDVVRWVGDAETSSSAVGNWLPGESAEKFHTRPLEHDGRVYVATLDNSNMNNGYLNTRGFHWYGYDQQDNDFLDLSVTEPNGVGEPTMQIVTIQKDETNNLLYGMSIPENKLVRYDIANAETTVLGKPSAWNGYFYTNRYMFVDSRGRVYISGGSSRGQWNQGESVSTFNHMWYYDPATGFGELQNFPLQGANALEVGQWDRDHEVLYTADDQGNIYRFVDATATWSFVGRPNFTGNRIGTPKTWVFQLSADAEKIYIGVSDVSYPNSIWEFDIATGATSELAKVSELDSTASTQAFITGFDSWDDKGNFYFSSFSMYNNVNVYMLGVNPVRIKAANDSSFDLVEVSSQSTAPAGGNSGVSVNRTGSTSVALEVLYEVRLYDAYGARLEILPREVTIAAGQSAISLSTASLGLPSSSSYAYAEFRIEADGNDYVVGENEKIILK